MDMRLDQPGAGEPAARVVGHGVAGEVWPDRRDLAVGERDVNRNVRRGDGPGVLDEEVHLCPSSLYPKILYGARMDANWNHAMSVNLSIKNASEEVVSALKLRAKRNH